MISRQILLHVQNVTQSSFVSLLSNRRHFPLQQQVVLTLNKQREETHLQVSITAYYCAIMCNTNGIKTIWIRVICRVLCRVSVAGWDKVFAPGFCRGREQHTQARTGGCRTPTLHRRLNSTRRHTPHRATWEPSTIRVRARVALCTLLINSLPRVCRVSEQHKVAIAPPKIATKSAQAHVGIGSALP